MKPAPWECHCCRPLSFGRRWRRVLCLAFAAAGREVRQSPLFRVAGASGSFALSRLIGFFDLAGHLGYEFEDSVLGLSAWTVVVLPFRDAFAVFRLRVLSVGAGELAFLDCGATDLAFLRGLPRVITKVDSKVRSLESPS